mgnify:CR=1 FL=1
MRRMFALGLLFCAITLNTFAKSWETASENLIRRVVKSRASEFHVKEIPASEGRDVFEIESREGKVILSGNSPVAVASALNWYLKYFCHRQVSWNCLEVELPDVLPEVRLLSSDASLILCASPPDNSVDG